MTEQEREGLYDRKYYFIATGNDNAAMECDHKLKYMDKMVRVVKGRKYPNGLTGLVFWVKRYAINTWFGNTRLGLKLDDGSVIFINEGNVEVV